MCGIIELFTARSGEKQRLSLIEAILAMASNAAPDTIHFVVRSCLGISIHVTKTYWDFIVSVKHTTMKGQESHVKVTLADADQVRVSKIDPAVFLYYKRIGKRFICVVARHLDGDGFIISTYPTDAIKEGEAVWTKSR